MQMDMINTVVWSQVEAKTIAFAILLFLTKLIQDCSPYLSHSQEHSFVSDV